MQQTYINSFFKRKETSATSEIQSITISTNNVNNDDVNNDSEQKTKTVNSVNSSDFVDVNNVGKDSLLINHSSFLKQLSEIMIVDVNTNGLRISSGYTMTWKETAFYVFIVSLTNISWLQNITKSLHTYQQDFEIGRRLLGALKNMSKANAIPLLYHTKPLFQNVEIQKRWSVTKL